ncbi:MAG: metalloenzyme domain protein [Deinococcus sp.]|nr:metalloenzyme domain protein [Deinococcus sp.]
MDAPPGSVWDTELPALRPLIDAGQALDAALGVPGLPQSATGQSCWLTGQDAVAYMGEHFGPQPGPTLRGLLDRASLPAQLTSAGGRVALANFYPPGYVAAHRRRPRHGCFPYSVLSAGLPLNPPDLPGVPPTLGLDHAAPWLPQRPAEACARLGERLAGAAQAQSYDLVMLDLWLGDTIGHLRHAAPATALEAGREYLRRIDALLAGLLAAGGAVTVTSDHGNLEDLTTASHTRARVPLAWTGLAGPPPLADVVQGGRWLRRQLGLADRPDE